MDRLFRNVCVCTEPIHSDHSVLSWNFRKFWLNWSRPCFFDNFCLYRADPFSFRPKFLGILCRHHFRTPVFERIYWVREFDGLPWNLTRIFPRYRKKIPWEGFPFFQIYLSLFAFFVTRIANFWIIKLDTKNTKATNRNIEKASRAFLDLCRIRYPINLLKETSVVSAIHRADRIRHS